MFEFLLCLLITVSIHELAHMLVALRCGIGVKAFSIGFGKPYLHKTIKGIDFRLSPVPLGGYCDLKGMECKDEADDFLSHRYLHKFAVLVAGAFVNILFALGIYLFHYGSISIGLQIDWMFLKAAFTQDYFIVEFLIRNIPINFFLLQLSLLNIFCGLTNLLPIPALDGGHLWMVLMEKVWKEKFIPRYKKITDVSFWALIIAQVALLVWIYWDEINNLMYNWILTII